MDKQTIIDRIRALGVEIDRRKMSRAVLVKQLAPHLDGYYERGTVMVYTGEKRPRYRKVTVVTCVPRNWGEWEIGEIRGVGIKKDGTNGEPYRIDSYDFRLWEASNG